MSLEKNFPTFMGKEKQESEKSPEGKKRGAVKSLSRKALPFIAAASTFLGAENLKAQTSNPKHEDKVEVTAPNSEDLRIKLPEGDGRIITFETLAQKEEFLKNSRLILTKDENGKLTYKEIKGGGSLKGHGNMDYILNNKKAKEQAKNNLTLQNIYNDATELKRAIERDGWNAHATYPLQIGKESPFWESTGEIKINNMEDYENHVKEDLWPLGFKGEINPEIKYFGFKLEKNEFITKLKHNTVVAVETQGGVAYATLLEGTRAVFEIVVMENGAVCNILKAMLDCKNPIYADEVYLRDGEKLIIKYGADGKRTFHPEKKNKEYDESKDL